MQVRPQLLDARGAEARLERALLLRVAQRREREAEEVGEEVVVEPGGASATFVFFGVSFFARSKTARTENASANLSAFETELTFCCRS